MGIVLILISALCFVVSSYFGKVITNTTEMSAIITSFSRFILGTVIMFTYIVLTKKTFKPGKIGPIVVRAALNCFSLILFSWALHYTTITNTNMLHMTYPVFVIILAPFITNEKIKTNTFLYLFLIMLGTYLVSNPSFERINIGDVIALVSAIIAAVAVLFLTEARKYNEGYLIVFYVMLIGTFINFPFAFNDLSAFNYKSLPIVFFSALFGFLGQVFLTWGYKYVDSATGSLVSTSRIIIAAAIGFIFLSEPLNLNIISGIMLIISSLVGISGFYDKKTKEVTILVESKVLD